MNSKETILIATASLDEHFYSPVRAILENRDFKVVTYLTDNVLSGQDVFSVRVDEDGELDMQYNHTSIHPDSIGSAWYRKLGNYQQRQEEKDLAKQMYVANEIRYMHEALWDLMPENIWLNSPHAIRQADMKLSQLVVAQSVGLHIPETLVTNDWSEVSATFLESEDDVAIVKTIRGVVSEGDVPKAMYTVPLDQADIRGIKESVSPFPGIYQPFLEKIKEWRVTVVGEDVFPASIYTESTAKDDWRKHQLTGSVEFKHEALPDDISQKCIEYLGRMGLRFGAFDFIETTESIVFLECNPNGQYVWLETQLGFPISEAIANELTAIASEQ
jgi:glutathione synthase/RimK-type ligase-like ATP-grasp enzyme